MPLEIVLALLASLSLLSLGVSAFILLSRGGNPALHSLRVRVDALETSHSDLVDRYDHLQRRVANRLARAARERKEAAEGMEGEGEGEGPEMDPKALKAALRRRARGNSQGY